MKTKVLILFTVITTIYASPFELTKEYIEKYQSGIADLMKRSETFKSKEFSYNELFKEKEVLKHPHDFDFIVVGAGTSGAVLASRLSEVPEYNVLLLEAGQPETPVTKIPAFHPYVSHLNQWGYKTTPQTHWCQGHPDHICPLPSAKSIGGTTATNEMLYSRGNKRDFDTWADEENKEWCYDDVLPYFKRSENAHLMQFDRKYHNAGGPLSVEDNHLYNITKRFIAAGEEMKYPKVDYNGKEQLGFSSLQLMTNHGSRASSFASFIEEQRRKNLYVLKDNLVVEILISPHTKEAQGVKYIDPSGKIKTVKATKEVILSAGALNTAKLLLLSGVGPKNQLKAKDIDCVVDLPVGEHLRDHPRIDLHFTKEEHHKHEQDHHDHDHDHKEKAKRNAEEEIHTHKDLKEEDPMETDLLQFLKNSHGALTQPSLKALAQVKTKSSKSHPKLPDIQLALRQDYDHETHDHHHHHPEKYIISVSLNHPKSYGSVKLASSDLLKFPLIDPNFYSDEDELDFVTMKEGLKIAREVAHHMGLHELNDHVCSPDNVKSEDHHDDVDVCLIKKRTMASGDFTGTARMGDDEHKNVVDHELKVHGVHKLRVVDLAVVPVTITGDVRATGIMIAEKAGDLIKHAWK